MNDLKLFYLLDATSSEVIFRVEKNIRLPLVLKINEAMKQLFEKKMTALFLVIMLWVLAAGIATFVNNKSVHENNRLLQHTHEVRFQTESIFSLIQDMVLSSRGFVITGDSVFLNPFNNANKKLADEQAKLGELFSNNEEQKKELNNLNELINKRIEYSVETIQLRKNQGFDSAQQLVATRKGKFYLDEIRTAIEKIQAAENKTLENRMAEIHSSNKNFNLSFYALIGSILFMVIFVALSIRADLKFRTEAEEKLKEFKHFFDSSNDLLCIANVDGYFEIMNPAFEKLLGYTKKEMTENKFLNYVHPDDIESTLMEVEKLKSGALTIGFLNRYRKKDGTYILLNWSSTPDSFTGKLYAVARVVKD